MISPTLSICVPSRNRQKYFQETIKALTSSLRNDVEFVFCDNSDDPTIMLDFIKPFLADPRAIFVPTGKTIRSMMDNWETAISATTGRWVTVIGDDDYLDPDLAGLIQKLEASTPGVEALDWTKLYYAWPFEGKAPHSNPIHLNSEIHEVPKDQLMRRAFEWEHARDVLGCGFGIYHGAIARPLLERMKAMSGGPVFEHPIVDYDNIFKVIMHGKRFVHCRRPLSVMGVCPQSNSAAAADPQKMREKQEAFDREHKNPVDAMECYTDFPFSTRLGLAACILMTEHWFAKRYGYTFRNFERNFVNSCVIQSEKIHDRAQFEMIAEGYRQALGIWEHGRYLKFFKPEFSPAQSGPNFSGFMDGNLFMTDNHKSCDTVHEYYRTVSALLEPIDRLDADLGRFAVLDRPQKQRA
jgi:glycosyltransferase involved in cell wall biosynthesis